MSDQDEQWLETDPATFLGECEECGKRRPLQKVTDPFADEGIDFFEDPEEYDPDQRYAWCRPCYQERTDDI